MLSLLNSFVYFRSPSVGKPREEIVHDQVSGRTRRRAVFNDNLEEELGDDDDDDEEEEDAMDEGDNEPDFEEIKLRPINPQVLLVSSSMKQ